MTVPSSHLFDILSGRKLSSFLLFEDNTTSTSCQFIWPILFKRLCDKYTSLFIRTELPAATSIHEHLPTSVVLINFWDYSNVFEFFSHLKLRMNTAPSSQSHILMFENLDALLLDCPRDLEIWQWAGLINSHLMSLVSLPSVASVMCCLNLYESSNGALTWSSGEVKKVFECYASSCVRLSQIADNPYQLKASFWHRRTLDSVCKSIRAPSQIPPSNKPSVSGICKVSINDMNIACSAFVESTEKPAVGQPTLPTSTFKLTVSKEENEAKHRVVLPHQAAINAPLPTQAESTIDYEPDAFDDFDDEDPDYDLDI